MSDFDAILADLLERHRMAGCRCPEGMRFHALGCPLSPGDGQDAPPNSIAALSRIETDLARVTEEREQRCIAHAAFTSDCPFCEIEQAEARVVLLEEALNGYHVLMMAVAECVNACGEALLYTDLKAANDNADAALAAGGEGKA